MDLAWVHRLDCRAVGLTVGDRGPAFALARAVTFDLTDPEPHGRKLRKRTTRRGIVVALGEVISETISNAAVCNENRQEPTALQRGEIHLFEVQGRRLRHPHQLDRTFAIAHKR